MDRGFSSSLFSRKPPGPPAGEAPVERPSGLFRYRVIINSGKGGVGKSTVSAALGALGARAGLKTLVVEFAGQCAMSTLLGGRSAGYEEVERRPNLFSLSVTPEESMEEYLVREMHSRRLYHLIFKNNYSGPFIAAVPGLEDLISIGKVMDLERAVDKRGRPRYDLIIVDAPATGQGLNLLKVPRAMMDMTRVGPFFQNTKLIYDMLMDSRKTVLNLVTLPEEMPVNETIDMFRMISRDVGLRQGYAVVNNVRPQLFSEAERALFPAAVAAGPSREARRPDLIEAVLRTGLELNRRVQLEQSYIDRLTSQVSLPLLVLPALLRRNVGPAEVDLLAAELEAGMRAHTLVEGA